MKSIAKPIGIGFAFALLMCADVVQQCPFSITMVRHAEAIVGAPVTPVSVAGVARRTTRRTVVATSGAAAANSAATQQAQTAAPPPAAVTPAGPPPVGTMVTTLPPGCVATTLNGVEYQRCGSTYYQAKMAGSNLVFVVAQP